MSTPYSPSIDPGHVFRDVLQARTPAEWRPCLTIGNRGSPNEFLISTAGKSVDDRALVDDLAKAIREIAAEHDLPVASMYMPERDARLLQEALGHGAVRLKGSTICDLDTRYASMEDYLKSLSSSRRGAVRKEMRRFWDAGYSVTISDLASSLHEVLPLVVNVDRKHHVGIGPDQRCSALEQQAQFLSDRSVVYLCRNSHGELVACSLFYRHGAGLYARHVGMNYRRTHAFEYFNLLFYLPIEYAIAEGIAHIEYGAITEAKQARGGRSVPTYSVLWRRSWPTEGIAERAEVWNARADPAAFV